MSFGFIPEVQVTPIPLEEAGGNPLEVNLGDKRVSELFGGILALVADRADRAYILSWQGDFRVPRGATVGTKVIEWTQHGNVLTQSGEHIGVYQRIKDVDGPTQDSEMLVLAFLEEEK